MNTTTRGEELYVFLRETIVSAISRHSTGVSSEHAQEVAAEVCDELALEWGGTGIYVPRYQPLRQRERNRMIFMEYNGRNLRQLAKKHGISEMRVMQIVKAFRQKQESRHDSASL